MEFTELILEEREFQKIRSIVYETSGISLAGSKRALVVSRLTRRLQQLNGIEFLRKIMHTRPTPVVMIGTLTSDRAAISLEALEQQVPLTNISEKIVQFGEEQLK